MNRYSKRMYAALLLATCPLAGFCEQYLELHLKSNQKVLFPLSEVTVINVEPGKLQFGNRDYLFTDISKYCFTDIDSDVSDILGDDSSYSLLCVCRDRMLHIYGATDTDRLRLYNAAGQEFRIKVAAGGGNRHLVCDLSSIAPGVYILDNGKETFKFIRP